MFISRNFSDGEREDNENVMQGIPNQSQASLLAFRRSSCDEVLGKRLTFETGLMDRKNTIYAKI